MKTSHQFQIHGISGRHLLDPKLIEELKKLTFNGQKIKSIKLNLRVK
jgi:hypothetical protein